MGSPQDVNVSSDGKVVAPRIEIEYGMNINQIRGTIKVSTGERMGTAGADEARLKQVIAELRLRVNALEDERDALKDVAERYRDAVDDLSMAYAMASDGLEQVANDARALMADYREAARERSQTITAMVQGRQDTGPARAGTADPTHVDALFAETERLRSRLLKIKKSISFIVARIARMDFAGSQTSTRKLEMPGSLEELTILAERLSRDLRETESSETYRLAQKIHRKMKKLRNRRSAAK
jgi:chromosome segregation ATPase